MRLIVADDHAVFRMGLMPLLTATGHDVVGEAATVDELLVLVDHHEPDAVIVDAQMSRDEPDDGLVAMEVLRQRHPDLGLLLLSASIEPSYASRLLEKVGGGVGYLPKDRVNDVRPLLDALDRISRGLPIIDSEILARLVIPQQRVDELAGLSGRQREVLKLMADGWTNVGIGRELQMSDRSVEVHVTGIFTALELPKDAVHNRRVLAVLMWNRSAGDEG